MPVNNASISLAASLMAVLFCSTLVCPSLDLSAARYSALLLAAEQSQGGGSVQRERGAKPHGRAMLPDQPPRADDATPAACVQRMYKSVGEEGEARPDIADDGGLEIADM